MSKRFPIYLVLGFLVASMAISCNSSSSTSEEEVVSSNVGITAFALAADDSVLANLDSVFFTIDLQKAQIYNADSLPKGTDVSKLVVDMTLASCYSAEYHITGGEVMSDTTFAYSTTDSIDFTGKVELTLVSLDLKEKRTYDLKVNVHQMEPDSLYWNEIARKDLPVANATAQKTVQLGTDVYCLAQQSSGYTLASADTPNSDSWSTVAVNFPFIPNIQTFTATADAFYILAADGELYTSSDGKAWSDCGTKLFSISGSYDSRLLGIINDSGVYKHTEYPATAGFVPYEVEEGFPVSDVSEMTVFKNKWALTDQKLIIGGVNASGSLVGDTWGYDGTNWGRLNRESIAGHKGMTILAYYTYNIETNLSATQYPTLLAFGGMLADGSIDNTVYTSKDFGVTWTLGGDLVQLPDYIPGVYNAQAFVYNSTLTSARSTGAWASYPSRKLPLWFMISDGNVTASRATTAITSWVCPYVYLVGGTNSDGTLRNNIWRGVINRLSFKPLY